MHSRAACRSASPRFILTEEAATDASGTMHEEAHGQERLASQALSAAPKHIQAVLSHVVHRLVAIPDTLH